MKLTPSDTLKSRLGYVWRGLKRRNDRERSVAGSELMVFDFQTKAVYAVLRNYVRSGITRNTPDRIWWLNATSCVNLPKSFRDSLGNQLYGFASKVAQPPADRN